MSSSFLTSSSSSFSVLNLKNNNSNNRKALSLYRPPSSSSSTSTQLLTHSNHASLTQTLKSFAKTLILVGTTLSITSTFPAKAQSPPLTLTENLTSEDDTFQQGIEDLKSLLQQKLENGQDQESLAILERLTKAQPEVSDWKFLMARLLNEMGRTQEARNMFEEILVTDPLSFEALFENALLMDRCGEGEAVIKRLQEAWDGFG